MRTLLYGKDDAIRAQVQAVLEDRAYAVIAFDASNAMLQAFEAERPELAVFVLADEEDWAACCAIRPVTEHPEVATLALLLEEAGHLLTPLSEAGIDDFYMGPIEPERLQARLQFLERRIQSKRAQAEAEAEIARRARQQAVVAELGKQALAGRDVQAMLTNAVEGTVQALGVEAGVILELNPDTWTFRPRACVGLPTLTQPVAYTALPSLHVGYVLKHEGPLVIEDYETEARFGPPPFLDGLGFRSGASLLIESHDPAFGLLAVFSKTPGRFGKQDIDYLQAIANVLTESIKMLRAEQALRESEAKARAILETTVDGIITINEQGIVESYNAAAERIFGYAADEVIGRNVSMLMPRPERDMHDEYIARYLRTGKRKIIGIGREVRGQRKDGTTFPMDLAVSEVRLEGRRIFSSIIRDITPRRQLEQEILRISDQERRRIGQDLHDGLGQMLTGTGLISQSLARRLEAKGIDEASDLKEIVTLIREADQYARSLTRGLTPVELDAGGLITALRRLASNAERLFGIQCTFDESTPVLVHDNSVATHLYRIAQEAVTNAVKHGKARHVAISMSAEADRVRLRITDDGVGFPEKVDEEKRGMGVHIMGYRARIIGATLDITCLPEGEGTEVVCSVPREAAVTIEPAV